MVLYGHAGDQGMVTEAHIAHYRDLAQGGAGLLIQEATCVDRGGRLRGDQLGIWQDDQIPGLREIVEAVHREGCPIVLQLHHGGVVGIGPEHLCPSPYRYQGKNGPVLGQEMTLADIARIREAFIQGGRRAYLAGYDGVELHGCHSYLLCQFLNPRVNHREDQYGDPLRLVVEIFQGIRAVTAPDFTVGIRLGGFEPDLESALAHAQGLNQVGLDFLDISYGFGGEMDTAVLGDPTLPDIIRAAQAIRQRVSIPVLGVGGIRMPEDAQRVLDATDLDMVDVGRSQLVDPQWANKARAGETPGRCLDCRECQWRIYPDRCPGRIQINRERAQ
jgi:2,4-dienoyl-CoA reductase-like NADH-dependent reductase (Old Yellow Enzyme family)